MDFKMVQFMNVKIDHKIATIKTIEDKQYSWDIFKIILYMAILYIK